MGVRLLESEEFLHMMTEHNPLDFATALGAKLATRSRSRRGAEKTFDEIYG
jgi:hypothetical protein